MDNRPELIRRWQESRQAMLTHLEEIDKNRKIYPLWTIREILAHLSGWDDAVIASIQAHVSGSEPPITAARGVDVYNAETVHTREGLDYDHIYREFLATRQQALTVIRQMPAEKVEQPFVFAWGQTGTLDELLTTFIEHELEHATDVGKIISEAQK